jgi:predicted nucleic acid-binding protein
VLDDRILTEYHEVLTRPQLAPYFRMSEVSHILEYITHCTYRIIATESIRGLPDQGDLPFLEVAWGVNKSAQNSGEYATTVPLVSGNLRHFPRELCRGIQVLSPAAFISHFS